MGGATKFTSGRNVVRTQTGACAKPSKQGFQSMGLGKETTWNKVLWKMAERTPRPWGSDTKSKDSHTQLHKVVWKMATRTPKAWGSYMT